MLLDSDRFRGNRIAVSAVTPHQGDRTVDFPGSAMAPSPLSFGRRACEQQSGIDQHMRAIVKDQKCRAAIERPFGSDDGGADRPSGLAPVHERRDFIEGAMRNNAVRRAEGTGGPSATRDPLGVVFVAA
jgi:hypothetical protein